MFNQPLSNTLSIAELAPKAATRMPETGRGDGAFGEALAGARTVHDRRESQPDPSRSDAPRTDRTAERSSSATRERSTTSRAERSDGGRADRAYRSGDADRAAAATAGRGDAADTSAVAAADASDEPMLDADVTIDAPVDGEHQVDAEDAAPTQPTAAATVAVAAAPVVDLDAIIVPTAGTVTQVASDAVDAAIRLAINPNAEADAAAPVQLTAGLAAAIAADGETAPDGEVATLTPALPGTEDAETGDVQGPTRPLTSTPAATSGPTPAAGAEETARIAAPTRPVVAAAPVHVEAAPEAAVQAAAAGTRTDAGAQLAATVTATVLPELDGTADADAEAPAASTALLADTDEAADVDVAATRPAQAAPVVQQPTAQAAYAAQAQAKAAEQAAEDGGEQGAAPKLDATTQQASNASSGRADQLLSSARMRDGLQLGGSIQDRVDHIAQQLATRLRLSQAAGGSEVQLSLKPRELGDVHVQMKVRDGQVAAIILVDKPETARTMQTHIEELKRSLENQGLQIQEFSVDVRGEAGAGGANARAAAELHDGAAGRARTSETNELGGVAPVNPGLEGDHVVDADSLHDGDVSVLA